MKNGCFYNEYNPMNSRQTRMVFKMQVHGLRDALKIAEKWNKAIDSDDISDVEIRFINYVTIDGVEYSVY